MAESALIVPVPEAEPLVGELRERFDPSACLGLRAHITVLYPFVAPVRINARVIGEVREIASQHRAFSYRLNSTGRFLDTLYLVPEEPERFVNLVKGLVRHFPGCEPYGGQFDSIVPHLTVARGSHAVLHDLERSLQSHDLLKAGIGASCEELVLIENSSGLWREIDRFPMAGATPVSLASTGGSC